MPRLKVAPLRGRLRRTLTRCACPQILSESLRALRREADPHVLRHHLTDELHVERDITITVRHHAPPNHRTAIHRNTRENDARGSSPNPASTGSAAAAFPVYFATYSAAAWILGTGTMNA